MTRSSDARRALEDMDHRNAVHNEAGLAADEVLLRSMKRPAGMKRRL